MELLGFIGFLSLPQDPFLAGELLKLSNTSLPWWFPLRAMEAGRCGQ